MTYDDIDGLKNIVTSYMMDLAIAQKSGKELPDSSGAFAALERLKEIGHPYELDFLARLAMRRDVNVKDMDANAATCVLHTFKSFIDMIDKGIMKKEARKSLDMVEQVHYALTNFPPDSESEKEDLTIKLNEIIYAMYEDYKESERMWREIGKEPPPDDIKAQLPRFLNVLEMARKLPLVNELELELIRNSFLEMLGQRSSFLENNIEHLRTYKMPSDDVIKKLTETYYPNGEFDPKRSMEVLIDEAKKLVEAKVAENEEVVPFALLTATISPETGEEVPAPGVHLFMICEDGQFTSREHQDFFIDQLRKTAEKVGALAYVLCVEAWMAKMPKGAVPNKDFRPSEQPDRVSAVIIQAQHLNGPLTVLMAERDKAKSLEYVKAEKPISRFDDILKRTH